MKCEKVELSFRSKNRRKYIERHPSKIITRTAEATWKKAAELHNDIAMISAIPGVDIIVKGFRKHAKCYIDYTKIVANSKGWQIMC